MTEITDLYRYKIVDTDQYGRAKPVARHGMGEVYKAIDLLTEETVALKIVREDVLADQPEAARRTFLHEAIAGARLGKDCPQIVKVYDIGQLDNILYMAQEWIPGGNIKTLCGHITLYKARSAVLQIARAVGIAHAHGIVHSDISPDNILHDNRRDIYKLADFGLLKLVGKTYIASNVHSGELLKGGKKSFMPPEHWDDINRVNYSTDVYALCVTFYQLITGELPPRRNGHYVELGEISIPGDGDRPAPFGLRQLFSDFVVRHRDEHRIDLFTSRVENIPA